MGTQQEDRHGEEDVHDLNTDDDGVMGELMPSPSSDHHHSGSMTTKKRTKTIVKAGKVVKKKLVRKKKISSATAAQAVVIKYAALFLLVAQMVGLVLLMRYTRTSNATSEAPLYLASTAVFAMECMKFIICAAVIAYQSPSGFLMELQHHVWESPMELLKLCVPSFLYTVQNNLLYLALTNLDAATYQVCYQLKILTTALFSALLLQRKFSPQKWASLVLLTVGVAIVQISGSGDKHATAAAKANHAHRLIGLVAVLCAACTSGFAGVYFEKILKGSQTTLWIRNIQMGLPSIIIAFLTIFSKDGKAVAQHGMFGGFNSMVWTVVVVQAAGGLIVAVVVKYADNVLKVFASSFSIIISCIISAIWFDFHATWLFIGGAGLVVAATVMYSAPEAGGVASSVSSARPRTVRKQPTTTTSGTSTSSTILPLTHHT